MAHRDDEPNDWNNTYSQQPYRNASAYGNLLGALGSIGYAAYGSAYNYIQGFSGTGTLQYNAQIQEIQSHLGTPTMPKPAKPDPSEIKWLKGRIKEIEWRP